MLDIGERGHKSKGEGLWVLYHFSGRWFYCLNRLTVYTKNGRSYLTLKLKRKLRISILVLKREGGGGEGGY